ncbi:MAG: NUDIX domain-containing protein [Syntrophomonadaceae bacterium]
MEESHVVTCFVENDKQVLIVRRGARVGTYQQRWSGISGYIEPGHSPLDQAWIELEEEAGLKPGDLSLLAEGEVLVIEDEGINKRWYIHPFRFGLGERNLVRLDWENTELAWVAPETIKTYSTVPGLYDAWEKVK